MACCQSTNASICTCLSPCHLACICSTEHLHVPRLCHFVHSCAQLWSCKPAPAAQLTACSGADLPHQLPGRGPALPAAQLQQKRQHGGCAVLPGALKVIVPGLCMTVQGHNPDICIPGCSLVPDTHGCCFGCGWCLARPCVHCLARKALTGSGHVRGQQVPMMSCMATLLLCLVREAMGP